MFFRIEDPEEELSGPEYFAYAFRMGAYNGVMSARIAQEQERQHSTGTAATSRTIEDFSAINAFGGEYVQVGG